MLRYFVATLGSCQGDFPSSRVIDFKDVKIRQTESSWFVETTVRTQDNTDRGFHNVTIVGRTEDGEVVCRQGIGNMSIDDDLIGAYDIGLHRGLEAYSGDVNGKYVRKDETPEKTKTGT